MNNDTAFEKNDHKYYNRHSEAFDVGETFAGVPFNIGLEAVEELKKIKPEGMSMAQFAVKWILMHNAVSTVIPGGKKIYQVEDNAGASELPPLSKDVMVQVKGIYEEFIKKYVHDRW